MDDYPGQCYPGDVMAALMVAELLATVGELPNGTLMIPRLLSDLSDAPMLGEAAILWQLSTEPERGFAVKTGGIIPGYVYIVLGGALLFGLLLMLSSIERFRATNRPPEDIIPVPPIQATLWIGLMAASIVAFSFITRSLE
ncbi:MAG TPA: hypothetical protein VN873_06970 [Candidatus Angelobacter sp.]|nr:hypothetical protein [Candidatus Angelobacter sp.]